MKRYILNGHTPVLEPDLIRWALWYESADADRVVAQDDVGPMRVSTVFLGIDHRFVSKGPPILFETMVSPDDDFGLGWLRRYATWAEAERGHQVALRYAQMKWRQLRRAVTVVSTREG